MLAMHVSATPPRLSDVAPTLAGVERLEPLIARGLAKHPEQRFESAAVLLESLDAVAASLG